MADANTATQPSPPSALERFRLGAPIGEGADMQVFAATDMRTGGAAVVKRPHPSLVSRRIHEDVERRMALQADLRLRAGGIDGLPRLYAITSPDRFDWYFGDDAGAEYVALVEERAAGVPLVGGVRDQVRGHPVGLPMNLFALHPAQPHIERGAANPSLAALSVIEQCWERGLLAGDLGPRNVFYAPADARATIVDLGALRPPQAASARRRPFDIADILFEFFQFYATPEPPPASAESFAEYREPRHSGALERMTDALAETYSHAASSALSDAAGEILARIGARKYASVAEFRADFTAYLRESDARRRPEAAVRAWRAALDGLRAPYWANYLFDAASELSVYD